MVGGCGLPAKLNRATWSNTPLQEPERSGSGAPSRLDNTLSVRHGRAMRARCSILAR